MILYNLTSLMSDSLPETSVWSAWPYLTYPMPHVAGNERGLLPFTNGLTIRRLLKVLLTTVSSGVAYLEKANHSKIYDILESIKSDKVTVYSVCKRFVDQMRKEGKSSLTVYVYRSMLPGLFNRPLEKKISSVPYSIDCVPNALIDVTAGDNWTLEQAGGGKLLHRLEPH